VFHGRRRIVLIGREEATSQGRVGTESRFMPARIQESFTPGASRRRSRPPSTGYIEGEPPQTERLSGALLKTGLDKVPACTGNGRSVHARQRHRSSWRQSDPPNAAQRGDARSRHTLARLPATAHSLHVVAPASVEFGSRHSRRQWNPRLAFRHRTIACSARAAGGFAQGNEMTASINCLLHHLRWPRGTDARRSATV
jgi:hypothetical protein